MTALDASNNTVTNYPGKVHFTSMDAKAALPANATLTNGVGNFSATLNTAGSQSITASDTVTGSVTGISSGIAVSAGAATHLSLTVPSNATTGSAFSFTVTALDASNNTSAAYPDTVKFSSTDSQAGLPANSTLRNGTGTFSATLKTVGNQIITATDAVTATITGTSNSINVGGPPAMHLSVDAPTTTTAGTPFNLVVTALDSMNNVATGYSGTVQFTSSDSQNEQIAHRRIVAGKGNPEESWAK